MDCFALSELYDTVESTLKENHIIEKDLFEYKTIASIPHKNF